MVGYDEGEMDGPIVGYELGISVGIIDGKCEGAQVGYDDGIFENLEPKTKPSQLSKPLGLSSKSENP